MPLDYHTAGVISVAFFLLSLTGFAAQLREIRRRRQLFIQHNTSDEFERPTAILSLNQFFASFLAFYSFLVYGLCSAPFNHYLVWTRLPATMLVLGILYEIWHDRRSPSAAAAVLGAAAMIAATVALLLPGSQVTEESRQMSGWLAIFAATIFGQGIIHQIIRVRTTGHTGAISLRMHQLTTLKDLSTILFALAMPFAQGWPLMTVGAVGVIT
ncbi:MAG: hypothetical protein VB858_11815, partial [Planctomycetaceae bacterium]